MFEVTLDWHDPGQTILIMDVQANTWEWDKAFTAMRDLKQQYPELDLPFKIQSSEAAS